MTKRECDKTKFNIPKYEIEALARAFLPAVLNYYRTEAAAETGASLADGLRDIKIIIFL